MESDPALGTLSLCLKMGTILFTSMTGSLPEGPALKGKLGNAFAHGNVVSALGLDTWRRLPLGICIHPDLRVPPNPWPVQDLKERGPLAIL